MAKRFQLNFRFTEILLLVFELNLGIAGVAMIWSTLFGPADALFLPAEALSGMLPAMLTVGFACWLVYRYRSLNQTQHRGWALVAAGCLSCVALGFGAAVGALSAAFFSNAYQAGISTALADPVVQQASATCVLAFLGIGSVFSMTFLLRAFRGPSHVNASNEVLHARLDELGARIIRNWPEQLVPRIDRILARGATVEAVRLYRNATQCSQEEAACIIADWTEQRLRLQIELLSRHANAIDLQASAQAAVAQQ